MMSTNPKTAAQCQVMEHDEGPLQLEVIDIQASRELKAAFMEEGCTECNI